MTAFKIDRADALIVVDPQNDFCPGGALGVPGGDEILPGINALAERFPLVVLTQDWHPADHSSFASNHRSAMVYSTVEMPYGPQILWPDHCVQGTKGAEFHRDVLDGAARRAHLVIRKGTHRAIDSYSAFYENDHRTPTGLTGYLRDKGVKRCVFAGLAYDFCAAWSALDAVKVGLQAVIVKELSRAIALPIAEGGTTEDAVERDFHEAGVHAISSI